MLGAKIAFKVPKRFYVHFLVLFFCKMASLAAGTKRGQNEKTLKYDALIQLERGMSNKDVARNFNAAKTTLSTWKKNKKRSLLHSNVVEAQRGKEKTKEGMRM